MPNRILTGGYVAVLATATNGSTPITVPATASGAIALWTNYHGAGVGGTLTQADIGASSMLPAESQVAAQANGDHGGAGIAHLRPVPSGPQNFAWTWSNPITAGGQIALVFYEDTGGGTIVRDAVSDGGETSGVSQALATAVGDLALGLGSGFNDAQSILDTAGLTLISADPFADAGTSLLCRVYDIAEVAGSTTIFQAAPWFGGIAAVSLEETVASGAILLPKRMNSKVTRHMLGR